jgi:predicted RNase H-like HicB family nuclease
MDERRLLQRIARGAVSNVAFADLCSLVEGLGFGLRRVSGSHQVFAHPEIPQLISLQSVKDAAYVADIPDLEAYSAFGASAEEALAEVERAKQAWVAAARDAGRAIPEPRYRPAIYTR